MKRLTVLVMLALMVALPALVIAGGEKPAPPQSKAFGKTLSEWQKLYWTWALGASSEGQVGNVLFMPIPQGEPDDGAGTPEDPVIFVGELDVTMKPGTAFVLPVFAFIGESYVQAVPDDDPAQPPMDFFTGEQVEVLVTLDGKPLIDSSSEDLSKYFFDAVFFDAPIPYAEPQPRGPGLDADAAIWVKGVGFVYPPLSVGEHTLTLFVDSGVGFGFSNTWHITVTP